MKGHRLSGILWLSHPVVTCCIDKSLERTINGFVQRLELMRAMRWEDNNDIVYNVRTNVALVIVQQQ